MTQSEWITIDAANRPFGRVASEVAHLLQGKHRPEFKFHLPPVVNVVVINCGDIKISPQRETAKYYRHSGYLGSLKERSFNEEPVVNRLKMAVKGMLPKNHHQEERLHRLHCYETAEHPHKGQTSL